MSAESRPKTWKDIATLGSEASEPDETLACNVINQQVTFFGENIETGKLTKRMFWYILTPINAHLTIPARYLAAPTLLVEQWGFEQGSGYLSRFSNLNDAAVRIARRISKKAVDPKVGNRVRVSIEGVAPIELHGHLYTRGSLLKLTGDGLSLSKDSRKDLELWMMDLRRSLTDYPIHAMNRRDSEAQLRGTIEDVQVALIAKLSKVLVNHKKLEIVGPGGLSVNALHDISAKVAAVTPAPQEPAYEQWGSW